jgi:hypothetical protein
MTAHNNNICPSTPPAQARDDARTDRRCGGIAQQTTVFARDDRVATVECGERTHRMQGTACDFMALCERCQASGQRAS